MCAEIIHMKNIILTAAILLMSGNLYSSAYSFEIGGKRSYLNYILPGNTSYGSDTASEYDLGILYKFNDIQTLRFNFVTERGNLNLPTGTTGESMVRNLRYELVYSHKLENFRPYIGIGHGSNSFVSVAANVVTMDKISKTYGLVGLEIMGAISGWATSSVGIEVIDSGSSRYTFSGYGKIRLEEASLHIDITSGYSLTNLELNNSHQRLDEMFLGIMFGKSFQ
jgi:hypothetical protein